MDAMTLLGAGLMIPALALLTQRDVARTYPAFQPVLHALGNPSQQLQTTLQQFPRLHCWTGRGETMLKVSQECSDASA